MTGGRMLLHHSLGKWGMEWPFDDMHQIDTKQGRGAGASTIIQQLKPC